MRFVMSLVRVTRTSPEIWLFVFGVIGTAVGSDSDSEGDDLMILFEVLIIQ
jgi:hypothetical protein